MVEITPVALRNIGYKTYIIFAVFNLVAAFIVYCFYPETSCLNLESVDLIFLPDETLDREIDEKQKFYQKALQWNAVPKSWMTVKEAKARRRAGLIEALGEIQAGSNSKNAMVDHVEFQT